ncbi:ABC transporter permease [Treponema pallidum]|uniref:ABC transporter permease n=1 Tax=Treponema pallidum TaxID=160 RepID=UPI00244EDB08|nr:ABC transporter permease [Treponema pallidum]WGK72115.1 spermidine/putrescine ABC superfamily ATP binding cassette transporter, membrane protein [Treponema pallidum subsp. pertenue]WGK73087.1 spermidine/putrescine ABC superfamily ATP binding cassette transporter, membrane protein [Treponema pallidum subsp. pertenue]WGK76008.1 spermidine/putrescine ABC superfamily ATP binding cassette transporter, membrane protein [Treponema pallidum subsp. pertenue]WGK76979.1 spermidine/putrescine ABC superf
MPNCRLIHTRARTPLRCSFSAVLLAAVVSFLFLPLAVIALFSFNKDKSLIWTGFSLRWYTELFFYSEKLWSSFLNSVLIASVSALVATIVGTAAAIAIRWYRFSGRLYAQVMSLLPMLLPEVITGMAMLVFFSLVRLPLGRASIITAHITFCLPFVLLLILTRTDTFDLSLIEAAQDLGANEWQALGKIVIPAIMPGILSGFLLSVTLSLEDFVITFFVAGPGSTTLPLYVFSMIRYGVSPIINALSLIMMAGIVGVAYLLRNSLKTIVHSK